jgi:hypothetical protein
MIEPAPKTTSEERVDDDDAFERDSKIVTVKDFYF